jgi:hypothetical protein
MPGSDHLPDRRGPVPVPGLLPAPPTHPLPTAADRPLPPPARRRRLLPVPLGDRPARRRSRRRSPRRTATAPRPRPPRTPPLDLHPHPRPPPRRQPVLHRPRRPRPHSSRRATAAMAAGGSLPTLRHLHCPGRSGPGPGGLPTTRTRPDGYGLWTDAGRQVPFFLEYDTGAEQLSVLAAKIAGYHDLFTTIGRSWPVLF